MIIVPGDLENAQLLALCPLRRVGKGAGTDFNANDCLSCAVPTSDSASRIDVNGGHGARDLFIRV
jgi:hypothetical protein